MTDRVLCSRRVVLSGLDDSWYLLFAGFLMLFLPRICKLCFLLELDYA